MIIIHISSNHHISKLSYWIEIKLDSSFWSCFHKPSELIPNDSSFCCSCKFKRIYSHNLSDLITWHHILVLLFEESIIELLLYLSPNLGHFDFILIENIHNHGMIPEFPSLNKPIILYFLEDCFDYIDVFRRSYSCKEEQQVLTHFRREWVLLYSH